MDLVGVGHIVNETIFFPDHKIGPVLGSPPAYSTTAASRQNIKTGIVTKIGPDFPVNLLDVFTKTGVDTKGIIVGTQSTCSHLLYDKQGNKEIRFPSRAEPITHKDIPEVYRNCKMIYVCTMEDDVPVLHLHDVADCGRENAIDLGGYGGVHMSKERRNRIDDLPEYALSAACNFDFVKASDEDCISIFGEGKPAEFINRLLTGKNKACLITMGSQGVLLGTHSDTWHIPAIAGKPIDTTGGGDTFMGGFLSEYLRTDDILKSAVFGSATALCVIEKSGGVQFERMPNEK